MAAAMVEFRILRRMRRVKNKLSTLEFRRADFGLFKGLLGSILRDKALEVRRAQESWLIFQAQEQSIPVNRESGKNARGSV